MQKIDKVRFKFGGARLFSWQYIFLLAWKNPDCKLVEHMLTELNSQSNQFVSDSESPYKIIVGTRIIGPKKKIICTKLAST